MRTYMMTVTDFHEYSLEVGELSLGERDITDPEVVHCSRSFAKQLLDEQPEMLNRGLCLTISDDGGAIRIVTPMDTVH